MSTENTKTLAVYEQLASEYLAGGVRRAEHDPAHFAEKRAKLQEFIGRFTNDLPRSATVLEIGSAGGTDARLLMDMGFTNVTPSDGATSFVEMLRANGWSPLKFDLITDDFPGNYDLIYTWRTLCHFTPEDVELACRKVYQALNPGGRFIFNLRNITEGGKDEGWFDFEGDYHLGAERYYAFWGEDDVRNLLRSTGFTVLALEKSGGQEGQRWFNIVATKN